MFVRRLGDTDLSKRSEENLGYAPFNIEQEEITMKSAKFRKCAKQTKKSGLFPVRFELGLCEGNHSNELCGARPRFALDSLYYHNTLNQVIRIYLLWIFCFRFALADIICFQYSSLGEIHRK